mmetsp:Transcript_39766/g.71690  ORF Transcript_39766/g.71690 Transcript_39766/m.71690 type:complete len:107 (+) Transcript_39766:34-354(+)
MTIRYLGHLFVLRLGFVLSVPSIITMLLPFTLIASPLFHVDIGSTIIFCWTANASYFVGESLIRTAKQRWLAPEELIQCRVTGAVVPCTGITNPGEDVYQQLRFHF